MRCKQPELFEPDAHGDRRDEEFLGERLGEAFERLIVVSVKAAPGIRLLEARDFDEGVVDRFGRLKHPLLAIGERFVPGGEDQLARHQQAGGIQVGLQFDPRLGLAGPADDTGRRVGIEERGLRRVLAEQLTMQRQCPPPSWASVKR